MKTRQLIPYQRRHRGALYDLLYYSRSMHSHLDWYHTDQWLSSRHALSFMLMEDTKALGFISIARPIQGMAWTRILTVERQTEKTILQDTLSNLYPQLVEAGVARLHILCTQEWTVDLARNMGWQYLEDIITMARLPKADPVLQADEDPNITIKPAYPEHLREICQIDHASFGAPWQMTYEEFRRAHSVSSSTTIAVQDQQILGYQISTRNNNKGHLARLGVAPDTQSRGVGTLLLSDLLYRFHKRGINTMTVNTQASNVRSQQLYEKFSFQRTGFDLPVWYIDLVPN